MSELEQYLKLKEKYGPSPETTYMPQNGRSNRNQPNTLLILIVVGVVAAFIVVPLMGGLGFATGGGEIKILSPDNTNNAKVYGNGPINQINGDHANITTTTNKTTNKTRGNDFCAGIVIIFIFVSIAVTTIRIRATAYHHDYY